MSVNTVVWEHVLCLLCIVYDQAALSLMRPPQDEILVLHCYSDHDTDSSFDERTAAMRTRTQAMLAAAGVKGKFDLLEGHMPTQRFIQFVNEGDFHFLAMGMRQAPPNLNQAPLGSFSSMCLQKANCNLIVAHIPDRAHL